MNETETETKVAKCGKASEKGGKAKRIFLSTVQGGPGWSGYTETAIVSIILFTLEVIHMLLTTVQGHKIPIGHATVQSIQTGPFSH